MQTGTSVDVIRTVSFLCSMKRRCKESEKKITEYGRNVWESSKLKKKQKQNQTYNIHIGTGARIMVEHMPKEMHRQIAVK